MLISVKLKILVYVHNFLPLEKHLEVDSCGLKGMSLFATLPSNFLTKILYQFQIMLAKANAYYEESNT